MKTKEPKIKQFQNEFWKACATDNLTLALNCVYFKDGYLYASNAQVLIKQPLSQHHAFKGAHEILDDKYIHRSIFPYLKKADLITFTEAGIRAKLLDKYAITFEYEMGVVYRSNYEYVVNNAMQNIKQASPIKKIAFNQLQLQVLVDATKGIDTLAWEFAEPSQGVVITSGRSDIELFAILSPCLINY